jgi:SOS-response transcriptional repressor LexA
VTITDRQADVLAFVQVYGFRHGRYPSVKEISAGMGKSTTLVHDMLCGLRDAGFVSWEDNKSRTLVVKAVAEMQQ